MKNFFKTQKIFVLSLLLMLILSPRAKAADKFCSAVFFGDSTTAHMAVRGGVPASRVWSGPQNTVRFSSVNTEKCVRLPSGEVVTLRDAAAKAKPPVLVITLGVSGGAGVLSEAEFKKVYRTMLLSVKEASPSTQIFVQSILPLSDKSVNYYKKITKSAVLEANRWIREVCASLSVPYIDSHSLLIGENGYLKPQYQNDEYMHLTASAYEIILANIKKHIENN